jgi:membrane protein
MRRGFRVLADTLAEFFALDGPFLAAGLAFYILLYCFPLLLLFVTTLGFVLEESDRAMTAVATVVERLFPASEAAIDNALESFARNRGLLGVVAVAGFLLFGTFLFGAVRTVLNKVFGVEQRRTFLKAFGADVVAMIGTGGILAVAVGLASAIALAVEVASRLPALRPWIQPEWPILGRALTFLFAVALLYFLFRVTPAKSIARRSLLIASVAGSVLLEISKWLFAWYVREARDYAVFYGALGGLVFFVLWIYYASMAFVVAATLGRVVDRAQSSTDRPSPSSRPLS